MRGAASRTAVLACQGRAAAHDRLAVGRFADPIALRLLDDDERAVVDQVRAGALPKGLAPRLQYEFVRGCAHVMVPRTIAIDDALATPTQLVVLGAGLDTRAWRLDGLAGTTVFEVDHPATQAAKRARLAGITARADDVRFVPSDFTERALAADLATAGHRSDEPTTWVWEGVVAYLTSHEVAATLADVAARSAPGSRLALNYQMRSGRAGFGRLLARAVLRLARTTDPWREEPHRSAWTQGELATLLARYGFRTVSDRNLLQIWQELGLPAPDGTAAASLPTGRVLVADRA